MAARSIRLLVVSSLFAPVVACDIFGPESDAGEIVVLSGGNQSDTAFATLAEPLTIEVRRAGDPVVGAEVRFVSPSPGSNGGPRVAFLQDDSVLVDVTDTTDASGRASVGLRLGARVGQAEARVEVPTLGVSREISFEIRAGRPDTVVDVGPAGIVTIGGTVHFTAQLQDAYGNPLDEPVACASDDPPLRVTSECTAEGVTFGPAVLRFLHEGRDLATEDIRVLPRADVVFSDTDGRLRLAATDSTRFRTVPGDGLDEYSWSPGGDTIVGIREGRMHFVIFRGEEPEEPIEAFPELDASARDPRFSPDGEWIYFSEGETGELWRVRLDGTSAEPLSSAGGAVSGREPWPSPDGRRLVFREHPPGGDEDTALRVLDLMTGSVTELGVDGTKPTWSPTGDWIAYRAWSDAALWRVRLIEPDGTPGPILDVPFAFSRPDWSSDGTFLGYTTGHHWQEHVLVEVATGVHVKGPRFPGTSGGTFQRLGAPAWRPSGEAVQP